MLLTTYDANTGHEYKIRDIVPADDISALKEAMIKGAVDRYAMPEDYPGQSRESLRSELTQILKSRPLTNDGIYVENGRVYVDVDDFIKGCVNGSFYPVEVPKQFIKPDFLNLLQSDTPFTSNR
jgi:hypothetical protein